MTKVKICGLSDVATLDAALSGGADYVGFVHHAPSPRHVELATATALVHHVRQWSRASSVVLLVDPDDDMLDTVARSVAPDYIQLHGHETAERVAAIRARFRVALIKAVPVSTAADVAAGRAFFAPRERADFILFDARPPSAAAALPGGNGAAFDWRLLGRDLPPYLLAGGLDTANVAEAISVSGAPGVDVSSGVERRRGEKDPDLIRRFLRAAKAVKESAAS